MNYQHHFHAGNIADVAKHSALLIIWQYLQKKAGGLCALDTHAGAGLYDLTSLPSQKTGEAAEGIELFWENKHTAPQILDNYWANIQFLNQNIINNNQNNINNKPKFYLGSSLFLSQNMRAQDKLFAYEAQEKSHGQLAHHLFSSNNILNNIIDKNKIKSIYGNGWQGIKAHFPPPEKRGVILIDPPFEKPDDDDKILENIRWLHKHWRGGTILVWFPIKGATEHAHRLRRFAALGLGEAVQLACLHWQDGRDGARLNGSGLLLINPPWGSMPDIQAAYAWFAQILRQYYPAAKTQIGQIA